MLQETHIIDPRVSNSNELQNGNNVDQRPNRVSGVPLYLLGRSISHWITKMLFPARRRDLGKCGTQSADRATLMAERLSDRKEFPRLTERNNEILRAEAFQHIQPCPVWTALRCTQRYHVANRRSNAHGACQFGAITSIVNSVGLVGAGTPRVLEFLLRITY